MASAREIAYAESSRRDESSPGVNIGTTPSVSVAQRFLNAASSTTDKSASSTGSLSSMSNEISFGEDLDETVTGRSACDAMYSQVPRETNKITSIPDNCVK
jgi:hypothetical protein